jgi:hypothetical protein
VLEVEDRVLALHLKVFAVESTVQREGREQVVGVELTGEVDCGGRRTAGRKRRKRGEGRKVSERNKDRKKRGGATLWSLGGHCLRKKAAGLSKDEE